MDQDDLFETQRALRERWEIVPVSEYAEDLNWSLLLEALEERIRRLLERNLEKLMTALYTLDVSEERYARAMGAPTLEAKAHALAEAILERESEKIITRKEYAAPDRERLTDIAPAEADNPPTGRD